MPGAKKYSAAFGKDSSVSFSRDGQTVFVETAGNTFVPQLRYAHSVRLPRKVNGLPIKVLSYQPAPLADELFQFNFAGNGKREALLGKFVPGGMDGEGGFTFLIQSDKTEILTSTHALLRVPWSASKPGFSGNWRENTQAEFFARASKITTKSGFDFWVLRLPQTHEGELAEFRQGYADHLLEEQLKVS